MDLRAVPRIGAGLADELIELRELEVGFAWCAGARRRHEYVRGLFRVINGGGHVGAAVVCGRCGTGVRLVAHDTLRRHHIDVSSLPLLTDDRVIDCERCGQPGAELHHWAPQALFPDADGWPMAFLCVGCHREWHRVTRTA